MAHLADIATTGVPEPGDSKAGEVGEAWYWLPSTGRVAEWPDKGECQVRPRTLSPLRQKLSPKSACLGR